MIFFVNEWIILNKKFSLNGSIASKKFRALPAVVGFTRLPPWCSLSEFSSRSSVLRLYPGCKKLRVTSLLLIVLVCREGRHLILATLQFIRDYGLTQFNGSEKIYRDYLQATRVFGAFPFVSPPLVRVYLCPTSFIGRILPSSRLS